MALRLCSRSQQLFQSATAPFVLPHRSHPSRQRIAAFSQLQDRREGRDGTRQIGVASQSASPAEQAQTTVADVASTETPSTPISALAESEVAAPLDNVADSAVLDAELGSEGSLFDPGEAFFKPKASRLSQLRRQYRAAMHAAQRNPQATINTQEAVQPIYAGRAAEHSAPFRIGRKKVYLPDFRIALVRDRLPAHYATFLVPLHLNKLDLRDYLFHAYSIRSVSITSRVFPGRVTDQGDPTVSERPRIGQLHRLPATKKMTVLMDKPFVWPEKPDDKALTEEWQKDIFAAAKKEGEQSREKRRKADTYVDKEDRQEMRKQARRLLERKERWTPPTREDGNWAVRVGSGSEARV